MYTTSTLKQLAEFPWGFLYAKRDESGGLTYYVDESGLLVQVVCMQLVDLKTLKFIVDNHAYFDTAFDRIRI